MIASPEDSGALQDVRSATEFQTLMKAFKLTESEEGIVLVGKNFL